MSTPISNTVRMKFALDLHNYLREYIKNADQKAIFFFSICSALIAFQYTQGWPTRWTKSVLLWGMSDGLSFIATLGLTISAILFLNVVVPRLGGSSRGYIYFKSVSNFKSGSDYSQEINQLSEEKLIDEWLDHCFELATITSAKYSTLSLALRIAGVSITLTLLLLLATTKT